MNDANKPYILIVEDEAPLVTLLRYNLEKQGFRVEDAGDGGEALTRITEAPPDLLLLDWMLPTMSGIEVCRQLRRRPATRDLPIIMLTARAEDQDAVRGLDTGADDYITKPFSTEALIARIRALLRRSGAVPTKLNSISTISRWTPPRTACCATAGRCISAPRNSACWNSSCRHPKRVFSREDVLNAVWGRDIHVEPRTVDVHIRRLRKAINGPGEMDIVRTVRAAGYALDLETADVEADVE